MNSNIIHSIVVCLMAFALPFMVSCSLQEEPLSDDVTDTALCLRVSTIGTTRSSLNDLSDNEKMKSLRVVVLHQDGTIEHNRHYPLIGSEDEEKRIYLKVTPNENKQIFLFANEESVNAFEGVAGATGTLTDFFESYADDSAGFADAVNSLYFAPSYTESTPIPMSSMYDITIGNEESVEKQFYLVRVATKFQVKFVNWRGDDVKVNRFTVASYADKNYLMARVGDTERNRKLFNGKTWIDWLKTVSDASSPDDDYATTDEAGWLKDYDLPSAAVNTKVYESLSITVAKPSVDSDDSEKWMPGTAFAPIFYLPESKNNQTTDEQEYFMTFYIEGRTEPFVCSMPNLKSLFRNTHVLVTVTMFTPTDIKVDVMPYESIEVEPVFGLTYDPISGFRIVSNTVTGAIQYWLDQNNEKWQLKYDEARNYTVAYVADKWGNPQPKPSLWFDSDGNRKSLIPAEMAKMTAVTDKTGYVLYWYDENLTQKWLVQNENYSVLVYQFYPGTDETINDCNPYGDIECWYDFMGVQHDGFKNDAAGMAAFRAAEEAVIGQGWKQFLSSIN